MSRTRRPPGIILSACATGGGKTSVALGILAALRAKGRRVAAAKVGPDYIDPQFHAAASGRVCVNLDTWAMRPGYLDALVTDLAQDADLMICEGVMGLFDGARAVEGAPDGSTADLARYTRWPVVLILDAKGMGASVAALVRGFHAHRQGLRLAGVILNRVTGKAHVEMLTDAIERLPKPPPILGAIPMDAALTLPSRHLGLVQAIEQADMDARLLAAADLISRSVDLDRLEALARPAQMSEPRNVVTPLPPLGARIAVAQDQAFAFAYPAILDGWKKQGAALTFFSPLADEAPDPSADAVFLPGGYPELHAGRLAENPGFLMGLVLAARRGARVYGECGGFMVLGEGLEDAEGRQWRMTGLLPLATSFAKRRLHLGYRRVILTAAHPFGPKGAIFRGHEFHYASIQSQGSAAPLFSAQDARGSDLGALGLAAGAVSGSFVHLIDREA